MMLRKPVKIRSKKITDSAKGENCTLRIPGICNGNQETTVFAHINGGGMGTKTPDIHGVYACSSCHDWMDGRISDPKLPQVPKTGWDILRALQETQLKLVEKGLLTIP